MSNHLAIATVTASMRLLLQEAIDASGVSATVTTVRPDGTSTASPSPRVNVYLYQVTPNAAWRNSDLPTRNDSGGLMQRPRAALDLHYLLTFYGDEPQLQPQQLLGSVVRALHARPVLSRDRIRSTIQNPIYSTILGQSNLAEDIELVKFTPTTLSLEELSKLWAVFFQTQYALSVTYQGTVVLIETDDAPSSALPVLERNVYTVPFRVPVIAGVKAAAGGPILGGSDIVIEGRALKGDVTEVRFGASKLPPVVPGSVADMEVKLSLPADLRAGVQGLQVEQKVLMGTPPVPHTGFDSNVAAFILAPIITQPSPPAFTQTSVDPVTGLISGTIAVNFSPKVGKAQRVRLSLNEFQAPPTRTARGYVFTAPKDNGVPAILQETDQIEFEIADVVAGDYLVRAQVDGAESQLERQLNNASPSFNQFIGPTVTIA